jgi:hypothetical protein
MFFETGFLYNIAYYNSMFAKEHTEKSYVAKLPARGRFKATKQELLHRPHNIYMIVMLRNFVVGIL